MTASANKIVPFPRLFARQDEREFLPAALEIIETPASPVGRALAFLLMAFLTIAVGWAYFGKIDIIATASGKVVPVGQVKVIQPIESGVVKSIYVKEGDRVTEGQLLVELDRTINLAERSRINHDLLRARLDIARLTALRKTVDGGGLEAAFDPPRAPEYEIARTLAAARAQEGQQLAKVASVEQQINQKTAEIESLKATIGKLRAGMPFIEEVANLREKTMKMEFGNRVAYLDAQLKLTEQRNDLIVQERRIAEATAARLVLEAQREQAAAEYIRSITSELAETEPKAAQFEEDLIKVNRRLEDQQFRAPVSGTVQQLALNTLGGVVSPAQILMVIVPSEGRVEIDAFVSNKDIGFVKDGDSAEIKVDTFNFTKYGLLAGRVLHVSRDAIVRGKPAAQGSEKSAFSQQARTSEPPGQELLYLAKIQPASTRLQIDDRTIDISPGMAVTVEIKTGQRRVIEYLLSPIVRYKSESLRER